MFKGGIKKGAISAFFDDLGMSKGKHRAQRINVESKRGSNSIPFCFNDALPLPHARGRGQVRLE